MKDGFTIIELIISIFILSVAIVGIFSAFSVATILTSDIADRLTATYLAQEGIEIVRNIRDTNWLNVDLCLSYPDDPRCIDNPNPAWLDGLDCSFGCGVDYKSTFVDPSSAGAFLYINTDGFYNYNITGAQTKFKRKLKVDKITDTDGKDDHIIKVIVEVSWDKKANILSSGISASTCGADNCIIAEGTLYNWYNYAHY